MYLGVDLGTSSVKTVILDERGISLASASAPLSVSKPQPLWSEQDPMDWVDAAESAIQKLPQQLRHDVKCMGLSGQMHGATLLDENASPLRPAILWNDGRAAIECEEIEQAEPALRTITGNKAMPGFTAPKLAWVRKHEPDLFSQIHKVLLSKDYLRLVWTGDYATDLSDASGTLWLNVAERQWSDAALDATSLTKAHMPRLHEGDTITGELSQSVASRLGLSRIPVVAGGGDQAAGAVGAGVSRAGEASLALGTSGVLFVVTDTFRPNPDEAAHAFCHALPNTWHQMAVLLSAASAIDAAARMAGFSTVSDAYAAAEAHASSDGVLFLPYLSGERTPHDDPYSRGAFFGLTTETTPAALVHAALEGVAFAFADGRDALTRAGSNCDTATVIGGGARSTFWGKILASAMNLPLVYREGAEVGPAEGAAKLAQLALTGRAVDEICAPSSVRAIVEPDPALTNAYITKLRTWRALYQATKHLNSEGMTP